MYLLSPQRIALLVAIAVTVALGAWQSAAAVEPVHATTGVVKKIDTRAKTIVIETADGAERVFKYTERTTAEAVREAGKSAKKGTLEAYRGSLEGSHAVVRYTKQGEDNVAVGVQDLGKETVKVSDGTIDHVDQSAHTVTVKTKDGGKETYDLSKNATVDTSHGVVDSAKWAYKEGDKVTVHYTEEAGKKVAYFIHHF